MKHMSSLRFAFCLIGGLALSACGPQPSSNSFLNRGGPESLLDISTEVVNLSTANSTEIKELESWVEKDRPSRAELNCVAGEKRCVDVERIFDKNGIPTSMGTGAAHSVTLVYERMLARDCDQRYVDNSHNHYNTNHASFGCSVAANMLQHVTDKQELTNPDLSDSPSAVRAVNDIKRAYKPRPVVAPYSINDATTNRARSSSQ